ncbi:tyrosine-type recombinase/integrase [Thiocapsa roseopersicina]|uniref:Site-specific recombinase XerD n=1 Tax=Thiocapsa roseopersicina TaxID=1058 RepID=A0A1H3CMS7_THIRO|nr:site-specific integrase [Thiocapsa roseopersicina]SDX55552.1 Site-specific recombinase XerD [Thiocapsa roseopersicina]
MPSIQLTDAAVKRLKTPTETDRIEYWDTKTSGLGLRVSSSGVRTWVMLLRVLKDGRWKQQRLTLGRYPGVTLAQARAKAIEAKGKAEQGEDPGAALRATKTAMVDDSRNTFETVVGEFLTLYRGRKKRKPAPRTLAEIKRVLGSDLFAEWRARPMTKITRRDVMDVLDVLTARGAEVMANRTLAYLSMLFGWALQREIIAADPTEHVKKPGAEQSRERVLTLEEMRAIWKATEPTQANHGDLFAGIVRTLMMTGQRREEVGGMRWSEIDGETWTLPDERTKNHREHIVHLSAAVLAILKERKAEQEAMGIKSEFVFTTGIQRKGNPPSSFSGWSKSKERLDRRAEIAAWTLHDLRRTLATRMAEDLNIPPHVIEATINHVSGSRAGVAGTYNRALYLPERRAALDGWAGYVLQIVGETEAPDNVVSMFSTKRNT